MQAIDVVSMGNESVDQMPSLVSYSHRITVQAAECKLQLCNSR